MVRLVAFGRSRLSPSFPLYTSRIVSAPTPITCSLSIYLYIMLSCVRSHAGIVPHGIDLGGLMSSELTEAVIDPQRVGLAQIDDGLGELTRHQSSQIDPVRDDSRVTPHTREHNI